MLLIDALSFFCWHIYASRHAAISFIDAVITLISPLFHYCRHADDYFLFATRRRLLIFAALLIFSAAAYFRRHFLRFRLT